MSTKRVINIADKLAKKGFSPIGGDLHIKRTRKDGSSFIEKIDIKVEPNTTLIGGSQLMASKLLGLEVANGLYTPKNTMEAFSNYKLDADSRMNLLDVTETLTTNSFLCGVAFGKEGADSQARDVVMRYEKGWTSDDLLPILYYRTAAEDTVVNNYANGYFLRSVENSKIKYYGYATPFKGYAHIIGGEKLPSVGYPSNIYAGTTLSCEYIIETEIPVSAEMFRDYFVYDQGNSYGRRISSFKVLQGQAVKVKVDDTTTVTDFRNITVSNVVPMTTISLEKDEEITLIYRMYF